MSAQTLTIAEVNAQLRTLGLPIIDQAAATDIKRSTKLDNFIRALNLAGRNQNAKRWLEGLLRHVGVIRDSWPPVPAANAGPASAAPHTNRTASDTRPQRPTEPQQPDGSRDYTSFHVYGGKAALCFGADQTRGGFHTVYLDAAVAVGEREYDWQSRIRLQLTRSELPQVCAVLLGYLPSCKFSNHGAEKTKGFEIEAQKGKFFVKVFEKDAPLRAVPMTLEDAFYITGLLMRQLGRAFEGGAEVPVAYLIQQYARLKQTP